MEDLDRLIFFPVVLAARLKAEKQHLTSVLSLGAHRIQCVTSSPFVRVLTVIGANANAPQRWHPDAAC